MVIFKTKMTICDQRNLGCLRIRKILEIMAKVNMIKKLFKFD